ncbi:cytochrome P450 [Nonomuraea typhae]|uniref:Cytochrome P450 n=1 Tax=Nonomuraea typhae TaxID=2603600 RepID=A0ABW7YX92_9ACTN
MPDAPRLGIDPFAPDAKAERIADRPGVHEALRQAGPLVQVEAPAGGPAWIVTDDTLARQVLADPRFAKDPALAPTHWHGHDPSLELPAAHARSMTTLDGPQHRQMRRAHAPMFTRRRILDSRDRITTIARDLLAGLAEESARTRDPVDLAAGFTTHYPLLTVCDLLGIPLTDTGGAMRAGRTMTHDDADQAYAGFADLEAMVRAALHAGHEDSQAHSAVLAQRVRAEFGDVRDDELLYMITGLVFAGQVTTEAFLGFLLAHQLASHLSPADDDVDAFVTETLRLHPPAPSPCGASPPAPWNWPARRCPPAPRS